MIYPCPKCEAQTELNHSTLAENETSLTCGECKSRLWIYRESFAKRALRKEGNIYCTRCGSELNHLIVCRSCGLRCPDYLLVQGTKIVRKQVRSKTRIVTIIPSLGARTQKKTATRGPSTARPKGKLLTYLVALVVVAALVAAGFTAYNQALQKQQYTTNFFRSLYTIKLGSDLALDKCAKISADWRAKKDAGQNPDPGILFADNGDLSTIRGNVDKLRQKIETSPKKYLQVNEKLKNLYDTYSKLHSLALTPSSSLPAFTAAVSRSEVEYRQALQEVKASLPGEFVEELKVAKKKYRALADF